MSNDYDEFIKYIYYEHIEKQPVCTFAKQLVGCGPSWWLISRHIVLATFQRNGRA